jgi:hypothetical protein
LPRKPLGNQRSGNAAADDQRVAFQVFGNVGPASLPGAFKPRRAAAAQVGLLGVVGFEGVNGGSVWRLALRFVARMERSGIRDSSRISRISLRGFLLNGW